MTNYTRYKGSPDVFDETGKYYNQATLGGVDPATIPELGTTRPDVKVEADFARLAGQNIPQQPQSQQVPPINTNQPSPVTVQAQPFTQTQPLQPSKFQQGFQQANKDLGDQAKDVTSAQGTALTSQYAPAKRNDIAGAFVQSDPFVAGLVKTFQDYISPQNQRSSLADTYKTMLKDTGIQDIDTELLDMKNVIEGSEEDLRTEITKAGGFATESQVQALTNARNKQLIKNYNTLLDTRNAKEKYLQTAIGLEAQDRQSADQRFESAFNMGTQLATLHQQMNNNARSQMQWLTTNMGFDGLYDATGGDPYTMSLVEQTLGLPQGGLLSAANQAQLAKIQAEEERQLGLQYKQAQIKSFPTEQERQLDLEVKQGQIKTPEEKALDIKYKQAQLKKLDADTKKIYTDMADEASGNKKLTATQYTALGYGSRLVQSGAIVDKIGDKFASTPAPNFSLFGKNLVPGFLKSADQKQFEQAKRNFVNASLRRESGAAISPEEFESADEQYFPKLGDDAGTLEQKRQNRILQTANFLREGGMDNVDPTKLTVSPSGELIELTD